MKLSKSFFVPRNIATFSSLRRICVRMNFSKSDLSPKKIAIFFSLTIIFSCSAASWNFRSVAAQQPETSIAAGLKWRLIGPFRGGRALAVAGISDQPNIYYFGAVGGGVWKTTDGGEVWKPIFDREPIASIGAIAVAPSDPNIIFVGTGEADMRSDISYGDGIFKSTDAGARWEKMGLGDTQEIGRILVDPDNPKIVLVAALGHGYGPNAERGVYRSADGGATWQRVLSKDDNTGAIDLCFDPNDANVVFASLWSVRRPPWSTYAPIDGAGSGIYKSTDNGVTWKAITGGGLPEGEYGRIGLAIGASQRGSPGIRIYALISAKEGGLYRSDDGGVKWERVSDDPRIDSRAWYFSGIYADPRDPDTVYICNTALYRSTDGGRTFDAIKGAPGGDDYHSLWIAPNDPNRMILGSDQGTVISVNHANTWSSWYNQPTAQYYHVSTDNQFPYFVYGAQQDSGTASIASRTDFGGISFRDWSSVGGGESGYVFADPSDPNIVYGGGTQGEVTRFNRTTNQWQVISPRPVPVPGRNDRFPWTAPIAFSPQDSHVLYTASQFLYETSDEGNSWQVISPDLTRNASTETPAVKGAMIDLSTRDRGVIYAIAPSPVSAGEIWAGTDTGLIHLTRDAGKTWSNVTPAGLPVWSRVSLIEASRFDAGTAYAAIDRHRLDDHRPWIYRTRDFGKSWEKTTNGIPDGSYVLAVREDPVRRGLLFAGTELGVYFSLDDGANWQSLQLNLPVSSIRDLAIHGNDLIVATHGRSFWILDDISPLREIDSKIAASDVYFFRPATAIRIRVSDNRESPLPLETPLGANPPAGAILDYNLKTEPASTVELGIYDRDGKLVRKFSSDSQPSAPEEKPMIAPVWIRLPEPLSKNAGMNRFVWDLRYPSPPAPRHEYDAALDYKRGASPLPQGPLVLPGEYEARLTVAGQTYRQTIVVEMDPRVKTSRKDLAAQVDLELKISDLLTQGMAANAQIQNLRAELHSLEGKISGDPALKAPVTALDDRAKMLLGTEREYPLSAEDLIGTEGNLAALSTAIDVADRAPTAQDVEAWRELSTQLEKHLGAWAELQGKDLAALNDELKKKDVPEIELRSSGETR